MINSSPIVLARINVNNNEHRTNRVAIVDRENKRILDITGMKSQGETIKDLEQILNWTDRVVRLKTLREQIPTDKVSEPKPAESSDANPSPSNESFSPESRVLDISQVKLLTPIPDTMPVWAAGVTYKRSLEGRNDEQKVLEVSKPRANLKNPDRLTAYDMVYKQDPNSGRPELFFKALPGTAVPTKAAIGIRADSEADVPEPELVLVLNDKGTVVGYTMGNDVSSRDIEGENPLYLPQAKTYAASAALGPYIELVDDSNTEAKIKDPNSGWKVNMQVIRSGQQVYSGDTTIAGIKNTFENLTSRLTHSQNLPHGAALFTGTGILPPNDFKLQEGDIVRISIGSLGTLENLVKKLPDGPVTLNHLNLAHAEAQKVLAA